jgi:hypothetical protein
MSGTEDIRTYEKVNLAFILISSIVVSAQQEKNSDKDQKKPAKISVDELIARHIASIGPADVVARIKSRVLVGEGKLESKLGSTFILTGAGQIASQGDKVLYAIIFNHPLYPYEKAAFDGNDQSLGLPNGKRTFLFGDFLRSQTSILKDGLFTGALSTAWPLLDLKSRKSVKLEYAGTSKIDDRQCYKLKYSSGRSGDLKTTLYFDAETYRHIRTTYEYTIEPRIGTSSTDVRSSSRIERYSLREDFSGFKMAGKLILPFTYTINITNEGQIESQPGTNSREWTFTVLQVYYDEPLEATVFKVS